MPIMDSSNFKIFTHNLTPTNDTGIKLLELQTKRALTTGEIDMAKLVFANSINYAEVYIHNDEFLPFGLQDNNTVMTPNGEIYFPKGLYRDDFSIVTGADHRTRSSLASLWRM